MKRDLSHLDQCSRNELYKKTIKEQLENRQKVKDKGLKVVTEELKQRLVATSVKLTAYEASPEQCVQYRMFQTNQVKLFEE